jgi:hypothetical protein
MACHALRSRLPLGAWECIYSNPGSLVQPPIGPGRLRSSAGSRHSAAVAIGESRSYACLARLARVGNHRGVRAEPTSTAWVSLDFDREDRL